MARSYNISQAIAANTTVPDVIQTQGINAVFGRAAGVTIYWNGSAAGLTASASVDDGVSSVGLIPPGSTVGVASSAGKVKTSEDFIGQFPVDANSKLLMAVTNTTAGSLTFAALVVVN